MDEEKKDAAASAEPAEKKEEQHSEKKHKRRAKNQTAKMVFVAILALLVVGYGYYELVWMKHNLTVAQAKTKAGDFINNTLMKGSGQNAEITSVTKENGMFKVMVSIGSGAQAQEITSYLSADGTKFFPSVMDIAETEKQMADQSNPSQQKPAAEIPKTDKPTIDLFVMSYCPYGTQIEKGILPVLKTLGTKVDFKLRFVSYSMHNDLATNDRKELDENLRQYCIQKNQPAKLDDYLTCFLKTQEPGQENTCMTQAGVNATTVASCMKQADTQFNVTKDFQDKSTYQGSFPLFEVDKADNEKYGVQGSPTLIINGVEAASAGRDSASLLKTICSAFNTQPKECSTELSSASPAPGFGDGTASGSTGSASCGN